MTILEALSERTERIPYITRGKWNKGYVYQNITETCAVKLLPTNSPDGCVVVSADSEPEIRTWQPIEEDLTADDWFITD